MAEGKLPEWLPEFVHEAGAYLSSKAHREAAGKAGTLVFFRNGMLASLEKISKGDGQPADQEKLKQLLDETEMDVNAVIERLKKLRNKIAGIAGGVEFAHDLDRVIYGSFGKVSIRERISQVVVANMHEEYLPALARQICNEIDGFNKDVARLGKKAERWGLD